MKREWDIQDIHFFRCGPRSHCCQSLLVPQVSHAFADHLVHATLKVPKNRCRIIFILAYCCGFASAFFKNVPISSANVGANGSDDS
jgi:hypothetical protein